MQQSVKWTEGQLSAINARGSTLLVSAAAGSGKTAVLTNRVVSKIIDDKCDITDFLIVTFTRAAASEMKGKILRALREKALENPSDRHLRRQMSKVGDAMICTIDSFCASLIKDNFNLLGIPAKMRIMDEAESKVFVEQKVNEVLEEFYAKYDLQPDSPFFKAAQILSGDRDDADFVKAITGIYNKLICFPRPEVMLARLNARILGEIEAHYRDGIGVFDTCWGSILKSECAGRLEIALNDMSLAQQLCQTDEVLYKKYLPAVQDDVDFLCALKQALDAGYTQFGTRLFDHEFKSLVGATKCTAVYEREKIKTLREAYKSTVNSLKTEFFAYTEKDVFEQCETGYKIAGVLTDMLAELVNRMRQEKIQRRVIDFSDLSHFAFEALVKKDSFDFESGSFEKTRLAQKLSGEFEEIFIDEYQDTNLLQNTLFGAVSNGKNLFMVGDLKQSIYRFRGADPSIFRHCRDSFEYYGASDGACQKIFLSENFRSNGGVINFVNALFSKSMNILSPGSYTVKDHLVCTKPEKEIVPELHLFEKSPRGEGDARVEKDAEREYIAGRILEFCQAQYAYSDIAVLARDRDETKELKRVLEKHGIPCTTESRESLFKKSEVMMMLCLLNAVDNPRRDIYLTGAMNSPFFGFTSDELYAIRLAVGKTDCFYTAVKNYAISHSDALTAKINGFENTLNAWREIAVGAGVSLLIRRIFDDTSALSLMNGGRAENLISFYDFAKEFETKDIKGLSAFLAYTQDVINNGFNINTPQESGNSVHIMTMHRSKGLEFPVCFVAGLNRSMNITDLNSSVIVNKELGISVKYSDADGIVSHDTLLRRVSALCERKNLLEEELRLLYVALTRAKQHLILTATVSSSELLQSGAVSPEYDVTNASSHLDFIFSVLKYDASYPELEAQKKACFDACCLSAVIHDASSVQSSMHQIKTEVQQPSMTIDIESLDFDYAKPQLKNVPQKLSVSQLHLGLSDDTEPPKGVTPYEAPAFISGKKYNQAAAKGTAMHTFVQFCDYVICARKGCAYEAERLLREGFVTPEQHELLDFKKLDGFFMSDLYGKICASSDVRREMRFNILVDAGIADSFAKGEKILVQGIIDCFFQNPDGSYSVVDFKTDRLRDPAVLAERHKDQINFYALAVQDMTGKPVKEKILYSFEMSRAIYI